MRLFVYSMVIFAVALAIAFFVAETVGEFVRLVLGIVAAAFISMLLDTWLEYRRGRRPPPPPSRGP